MDENRDAEAQTELRTALGRVAGERRFIVENIGAVSAFDVHVTIESEGGKVSPVVAPEREKKFPLRELPPGDFESLQAIITTGTGIHFRAQLSWMNPDGSREKRTFHLSA
jgi:hypothetical protein